MRLLLIPALLAVPLFAQTSQAPPDPAVVLTIVPGPITPQSDVDTRQLPLTHPVDPRVLHGLTAAPSVPARLNLALEAQRKVYDLPLQTLQTAGPCAIPLKNVARSSDTAAGKFRPDSKEVVPAPKVAVPMKEVKPPAPACPEWNK